MSSELQDKHASNTLGTDVVESPEAELEEYVVRVNRCSKVVKGGRRLSFSAVVVIGDHQGRIGYGLGKANEVANAIRKGGEVARKSLFRIKISGDTIPHEVFGKFAGAKVLLKPAGAGTGVIAGGGVRAVLHLSGIRNVLSKSLGSSNKWNVVHATIAALRQLRTLEESNAIHGVSH